MKVRNALIYTLIFFSLKNVSEAKDFLRIVRPLYLDCESLKEKNIGYILKVKYDTAFVRQYVNPILTKAGSTEEEIYKITNEDENTIYLEKQIYTYATNPKIIINRAEGKIYLLGYIEYNCKKINKDQFDKTLSIEEKRSKGEVKPNKF